MHHLFLDTATERAIIGIAREEELIGKKLLPAGLLNSKYLIPALMELLEQNHLRPNQLEYICSGVGPGSYTGIRVGAALAQSMAYALKIPLIAFSSLEGFVPESKGRYAAILDAKYAGVYLQKGDYVSISERLVFPPEVVSLQDLEAELKDIPFLVTPKLMPLKEKIEAYGIQKIWQERPPCGVQIAHDCRMRFLKGAINKSLWLDLLYLRKTQAENEKG